MKLIVGLGNPGMKYANTRHNIGFMAVDLYASSLKEKWKLWGQSKNSEIVKMQDFILLKPLTYMNVCGSAILECVQFFKIQTSDICIIHDDIDLPFEDVRLKIAGGDGGHNGLKSILQSLSDGSFSRIRMGIGRPPHPSIDPAEFVLTTFKKSELRTVEDMLARAIDAISAFLESSEGFKQAMNQYNRKRTSDGI